LAWCSVKAQGLLYIYLYIIQYQSPYLDSGRRFYREILAENVASGGTSCRV